MSGRKKKLEWLEEFERMAEEVLSKQETSACDQIHPIVKDWYEEVMTSDAPDSRDAVVQAMSCLSAEVMIDMPERLFHVLSEAVDEEEVAVWLHEILMVGRAFERALNDGRLDDL